MATATRVDLGAITANDYVVTRTGTGFTVRRQDTGASVAFTGTGTGVDPLLFDGMSVAVGAGSPPATSSSFTPTRDAIEGFAVAITDPGEDRRGGADPHQRGQRQHRQRHDQRGRGARSPATRSC